jgi:hypothetical protein
MCTYNGARYVREQLKSIASQTRLPDELIVSDDRSHDGTLAMVKEFAHTAPFPITISVNTNNVGVNKNFENAIRLCKGDVISLSDGDDVWEPHKLEMIEQLLTNQPGTGLVFTEAELVDAELEPLGRKLSASVGFDRRKKRWIRKGKAFDLCLAQQTFLTGATMAFRAEFNDIILPIPDEGPLYHDGWIALILSPLTGFGFIDHPTIKYRIHSGQCVGIPPPRNLNQITGTKKTESSSYLSQAAQFQEAYERLANTPHSLSDELASSKLRKKIQHLEARAGMPSRRHSRFRYVLKELATLHYHRYSRGWLSAGKDLLV